MAIEFLCPGCHSRFLVDDSMAGSQVQCQNCATLISLEGLQPGPPGPGQFPNQQQVQHSQQPSHPQSPIYPPQAQAGGVPNAHSASPANSASVSTSTSQISNSPKPQKTAAIQDFGSTALSNSASTALIYAIGGGFIIIAIAIGIVIVSRNLGSDVDGNHVSQASETKASNALAPEPEKVNAQKGSHPNDKRAEQIDRNRVNARQSVSERSKLAKQMELPIPVLDRKNNPPNRNRGNHNADPKIQDGFQPKISGVQQGTDSNWGTDTLRIPFKNDSDVTFGPIGCPIVVVKNKVWHIEKKAVVQTLQGDVPARSLKAISGHGKWFAVADKSPNQRDTAVKIWNAVTGEQVLEVPGKEEHFVDLLRFSRQDYLLLGGRLSNEIEVHEVSTGKQFPTIVCPSRRVRAEEHDFTSDGKYFTASDKDTLIVVDTKTKKTAAVMESPQNEEGKRIGLSLLKFVKFAPDAQELAAIIRETQGPRLLVWNSRGKLVFNKVFPRLQHVFFFDPRLEWLPDKSGWIISGHIVDRKLEKVVFGVRLRFAQDPLFFPLDRTQLVGSFPYDPNALQVAEIPWKDIDASISLMNEGAKAILSPSQKVGLRIEMSQLRGSSKETENLIRETFIKRLSNDGLQVGDTGKATFVLRMSEKAGDTLPIYERQNPFEFRGRNTGRSATEVEGRVVIELVYENKVLWRDLVEASSSRMFSEPITSASIRKSMLDSLTRSLNQIGIPYFIPQSEKHLALPVIIK